VKQFLFDDLVLLVMDSFEQLICLFIFSQRLAYLILVSPFVHHDKCWYLRYKQ